MQTPLWALDVLVSELDGIEAGELKHAAHAAAFPYLKDEARRRLIRDLEDAARPRGATPPNAFTPELFNDLDAAAALLTGLGIEVRRANTA
jgi:hypothetical protein